MLVNENLSLQGPTFSLALLRRASDTLSVLAFVLGLAVKASGAAVAQAPKEPTKDGGISILTAARTTRHAQSWVFVRNPPRRFFNTRGFGPHLGTQATLFERAGTSGSPLLEDVGNPGDTLPAPGQVSNLAEGGGSNVGVGILTATPDKAALTLRRGHEGLIVFRNDEPKPYLIEWRLFIPNEGEVAGGTVPMPPKSSVPQDVTPPPTWFTRWFSGLFKDEQRAGLLTLRFMPRVQAASDSLAVKTIPIDLQLAYWDKMKAVGNVMTFLVLLAGGVCSLLLGLWIPNKLLKAKLAGRLGDLAKRTHAISGMTDSRLRVAVRVERMRLEETLRAVNEFSPDAPELLKRFEQESDILGRRIDLVVQLDQVSQKLDVLRAQARGAPQTILKNAARALTTAATLLLKPIPTDGELQQAQTSILSIEARLARIEEADPELVAQLAARVKVLRERFDEQKGATGKRKKCIDLRPVLKDLFEVIDTPEYATESAITPDKYHWIDLSTDKLDLLGRYIVHFEDTEGNHEQHSRVRSHEATFLRYLGLQSWYALNLAHRLMDQIEDDIFTQDVEQALLKNEVSIERDPLTVYPNEAVRLRTKLRDRTLDTSAARLELTCVWDFPEAVGDEEGWDIVHYFRKQEEAEFVVRFKGSTGAWLPVGGTDSVLRERITLRARPPEPRFSDRWKIEGLRLSLALGLAVLALLGGARQQLLKLDLLPGLIAVFLIGVSADTVKSLFSRQTP